MSDSATDSEATVDAPEPDGLALSVLDAVSSNGGEANTSEIKSLLDVEGDNARRKIVYRVTEHLQPRELVETHQPTATESGVPPKQVEITDAGEAYLDSHSGEVQHGGRAQSERIQELEQRVAQLEAENAKLIDTVEAHQSRLDDVESRTDKLLSHPLIESPKGIEAINDALTSSQVVSLLLSKSDDIQIDDAEREKTQERVIEQLWDAGRLFETEAIVEAVGVDDS